jgi:hypothetical protein
MVGGSTVASSIFTYALKAKLKIGPSTTDDILTTAQVATLDGYFYQKPTRADVTDAILDKYNQASS